ncbi:Nuclear RNA export factor 1 [Blattella germanica]|nr:Nuclear RNA export factor 1 [Blattella germanica]
MPKRGNKGGRVWNSDGGGGRDGKHSYYEHDDRVGDTIRRVSFKTGGSNNRMAKQGSRKWDMAIRATLEDDDVDMNNPGSSNRNSGRYNPYSQRGNNQGGSGDGRGGRGRRRTRNSPPALSHINRKRFSDTAMTWFKVTLLVKVRADLPRMDLNDEYKEKIKNAMVKRYKPDVKALDLSKFHMDPDLVDTCSVALFRPNLLIAVIDIIAENVPELVGLDLSNNKLYVLGHLSTLNIKLPNLRALHIGKNRLRDIHCLDCLEDLKIEELVLDGNPLCGKFTDQAVYVSEVRKRFPKVLKLDGIDLPPPIVFDVNDDLDLPPSKANFLINEEGMKVVRPFLEQYYQLYDSDDRQPLVNAYHENAMFSLTTAYPPGQSSTNGPKLATYMADSRNLIRIKDSTRRQRTLYNGKLKIVAYLSSLPKTQHDPLSFTVDLSIFTPQLIMMSVTGVFIEPGNGSGRNPPLRAFNRVFVIIPYGEGFCIINEQLFITNATEAQKSGMNVSWARKCLDETKWDYQQATSVFAELHRRGTIPAEAFIK